MQKMAWKNDVKKAADMSRALFFTTAELRIGEKLVNLWLIKVTSDCFKIEL